MRQNIQNALWQTETAFADVVCRLYPFVRAQSAAEQIAWHTPIAHEHSFYELMLGGETGYRLVFGDAIVELKPHHGYVIPAGVPHCAADTLDVPHVSIGFSVEPMKKGVSVLCKALNKALSAAAQRPFPLSEETEAVFAAFCACGNIHMEEVFRKQTLAYRLIYGIFRDMHVLGEEVLPRHLNSANVRATMEFLLERRQYRLEDIAAILGYTPKYTAQLIKKQYGCDFRTLRRRMLLEGAKNYLLADRRIAVAEIARLLGYRSPSAFYDFFKREMGCTPDEYRQQNKGEQL